MQDRGYGEFIDLDRNALLRMPEELPVLDLHAGRRTTCGVVKGNVCIGEVTPSGLVMRGPDYFARLYKCEKFFQVADDLNALTKQAIEIIRDTAYFHINGTNWTDGRDVCVKPILKAQPREWKSIYEATLVVPPEYGSKNPFKRLFDTEWVLEHKYVSSLSQVGISSAYQSTNHLLTKVKTVDPVPDLPWGDVDYDNNLVADIHYMEEYNNNLRFAMQLLMALQPRGVVAPCDGAGVFAAACVELDIPYIAGDYSPQMCYKASLQGLDVRQESYEKTFERMRENNLGNYTIIISYAVKDSEIAREALDYSSRVIILDSMATFIGRGEYTRYKQDSNIYYHGVTLPSNLEYRHLTRYRCNFRDFFNEDECYYIDNEVAYELMRSFQQMGYRVRVACDYEYEEGFEPEELLLDDCTYLYYDTIRTGFSEYVDLLTGQRIKNPFAVVHDGAVVSKSHLLTYYGTLKIDGVEKYHPVRVKGNNEIKCIRPPRLGKLKIMETYARRNLMEIEVKCGAKVTVYDHNKQGIGDFNVLKPIYDVYTVNNVCGKICGNMGAEKCGAPAGDKSKWVEEGTVIEASNGKRRRALRTKISMMLAENRNLRSRVNSQKEIVSAMAKYSAQIKAYHAEMGSEPWADYELSNIKDRLSELDSQD